MGWYSRNEVRIKTAAALIVASYIAAGVEGAVAQALFIAFLVGLADLGPWVWNLLTPGKEENPKPPGRPRVVYVRIQRAITPKVELDIGGEMQVEGGKDVGAKRYEGNPESVLYRAVGKRRDPYHVTHYVEQNPEVSYEEPLEEIPEGSWIAIRPEDVPV